MGTPIRTNGARKRRPLITFLLAAALGSALVVSGCGGDDESAFDQYKKEVSPLVDQLGTLAKNYAEVSGDNYTTDQKMSEVVSRDLPKWESLGDDLDEVDSEDQDIEDANDLLVDAVRAEAKGMTILESALETQDPSKVTEANKELASARSSKAKYDDAIDELDD